MSLEVQAGYNSNREEGHGLVGLNDNGTSATQFESTYKEDDMLPAMLEKALEKAGVMNKISTVLDRKGQIKNEFARCVLAEFMGTLLFQMFGGSAPAKDSNTPAANGFALVAVIYAFANISGAHINPAVTFALVCTGHMKWWKGLLYMIAQILGAIFGALLYTALIPTLRVGAGAGSPGCFAPAPGVRNGDVFGWEVMMTFLLVITVYAAAVAKPGHGNTAPLAIGLSLYAAAISGGQYTGASLNPARTIGPAVVFTCNVGVSFVYIVAEFFGAACAAGLATFLYGLNRPDLDRQVARY